MSLHRSRLSVLSAAALALVSVVGTAHANVITGGLWHVPEAVVDSATGATLANVPGTAPDVAFSVNSPFSFSGTSVSVGTWLASSSAFNIVENTAGTLASLILSPGGHFRQRVAAGNEVENRALGSAPSKLIHCIYGERTRRRFKLDERRNEGWDPRGRQTHHGIAMRQRNQVLQTLVRRCGGNYKIDLIETEEALGSPRNVEVPEVDGVEGAAEYS